MKPGGDGFGVPLKAGSARQLLLLKPADYDFSGDRSQWALPGPAEKRDEVWRVWEIGGEKGEGRAGEGREGHCENESAR